MHLEHTGKLLSMLLDLVEVAESHTDVNLGTAFMNVLENFGLEEKVRVLFGYQRRSLTHDMYCRYSASQVITH